MRQEKKKYGYMPKRSSCGKIREGSWTDGREEDAAFLDVFLDVPVSTNGYICHRFHARNFI
jgi:hypothetical protein